MKASLLRNCSTTRNIQIQIHSLQKLVEEALVSIALSPELNAHRLTTKLQYRSTNRPKPPSDVSEKAKQNNNYLTPNEFGIFRDPEGYARAIDGHALQVSREDIADILQMANGAENLFMQQHNIPEHQQRVTNELYDTTGGVDDRFKPKYQKHTRPSNDIGVQTSIDRRPDFGKRTYDRDGTRRFHWEERMCMGST
ncbi:hypothetical protein F2Q70_00027771 [Brassica cretica]|uniref:Uncharacterized protein n=1 Tax=Brassica cretica TaxID=69181 RepID=A0A8S9LB76_BRACR|nr:hypothetical protein F2Q70_00027771 [Brassica cretica]